MLTQARSELDQGIREDPKRSDLLLLRARLNLYEDKTEDAGRDLHTLTDLTVWNGDVAMEKARYHHARGEKIEEGNRLTDAIKLNPRLLSARLQLSRLLNEGGKADAALRVLEGATESERLNPEYILYRNAVLMSSGQWGEAAQNITAALNHSRTATLLGQEAALRIHNKDYSGGRRTLEEALKLNPGDQSALGLMALVFRATNQPQEYVAWIERYAEANPGNPLVQIYAARILRNAGNPAGARRELERAASEGAEAAADVELATLDIQEGKTAQAVTRIAASIKKHDSVQARILLANIYFRNQDWPRAEEQLRASLAMAPADAAAMMNLAAVVSRDSRRAQEAMNLAQRALALSPGNAGVESSGGWLYYLAGRYQRAIQHLQAALKSSDIASTRYHLAAACFRGGDESCARTQYAMALKTNPNDPARSEAEALLRSR